MCIFLKDKLFQLQWYENTNIFNTIRTCVGDRKEKVHLDNQSSVSPKLELIILLSSVIGNSSSPNFSPLWGDKSNEVLLRFCSNNLEMWWKVVQGKYTDLNVKNHLWSLRCYFWGRWGPATEGLDLMIFFIVSSKNLLCWITAKSVSIPICFYLENVLKKTFWMRLDFPPACRELPHRCLLFTRHNAAHGALAHSCTDIKPRRRTVF